MVVVVVGWVGRDQQQTGREDSRREGGRGGVRGRRGRQVDALL